jgi:hypothetical protein
VREEGRRSGEEGRPGCEYDREEGCHSASCLGAGRRWVRERKREGHRGPCVSVKGDELLLGACVMKFNGGVIDCTRPRLKIEFDDIFMSGSVKGDK